MTREEIDGPYRREWGAILETFIRRLGDFDVAEEALQEAFAAAIQQWPGGEAPDEPIAWIVQMAKHKAIDRHARSTRRSSVRWPSSPVLRHEPEDAKPIQDDLLRLLFACCHLRKPGLKGRPNEPYGW